jgi:hypothetical protein
MEALNGRHNQQERGLSVNQDKIRPKLTSEERKTMTEQEKKAYNALRLKEYRNAYSSIYSKEVHAKRTADARKERKEALIFYQKYKAEQAQKAV